MNRNKPCLIALFWAQELRAGEIEPAATPGVPGRHRAPRSPPSRSPESAVGARTGASRATAESASQRQTLCITAVVSMFYGFCDRNYLGAALRLLYLAGLRAGEL